jgi:hypothetical protein
MTRRLRIVLAALTPVLLAGGAVAARQVPTTSDVVVHEWGTFTSVAGEDGQAIEWLPLSGPSDLPCFVKTLPQSPKVWYPGGVAGTPATVRMETPVLYFYTSKPADLRVQVWFPKGLITEWFPDARVSPLFGPKSLTEVTGEADWAVRVEPDATVPFITEKTGSHYYAARATDAAPVKVGGQYEKFLFYRGVASFPVPISARVANDGEIALDYAGQHDIPKVVLFERRAGRIGYRVANGPRGVTMMAPPVLDGSVDALRGDLVQMLIAQGLYPREAEAMVETWRDSWFEEGTRLFYILPQAMSDAILPIEITPAPKQIARVFVGRIEVITPAMEIAVARAIDGNDLRALANFGRVLTPIVNRLLTRSTLAVDPAKAESMLRQVAASFEPESPCR